MEARISCTFWGTVFSIPSRLEALIRHGYVLPKGAEDEIRLIKRDLEEVVGILQGQRNKKLVEHAMVAWTKEVRELSYDIEDFIDQYKHAVTRPQSWSNRRISRRKFHHHHRSTTTPRLPSNLRQRLWMANKIREFSVRVQDALQRYSRYNLGGAAGTSARYASLRTWHPRPSGNDIHLPVGIGAAMNKLQEWLLDTHDAEQQKLKVVSIVGCGGVGKTTLANELYRKVGPLFECRAFIRLSRKPDMRRIFISMLSQVCPNIPPDNWKVHSLISTIRTHLQDKRYLIIVDDLWAMSTLDIIKYALPEDNSCSRIITITEIEVAVLQSCGYDSKYVFKMKPLNADDSRELFFSTVFGPRECPPELKEVSSDIIRKCGGLPLAIVIVASMLASQLDIKEQWDYLNNSLSHILMTNSTWEGMKQVLNLSYDNLPQNLKVCMLYLSMYPEGNIILKDDLVNQWIAEGFICATEGLDREEISRACFDELVGQNLIQPVHINDIGDVLSCTIHPMVLNFIITYKSIGENVVTAIHHSEANITLADKVRRLSLHFGNAEDAMPPTNMRLSQVRTLAFFGVFKCMPSIVEFRLIQVLILHLWGDEGVIILDLTRISELFRLRYLMIASNVTLELRTHMSGVQHLETLKIDARVSAVPSDIVHLPGLLHLNLPAETNLPNGICHMKLLRTLGYFDLSSNSTENVQSLSSLTNLQHLQLTCTTRQEPCDLESKIQFVLRSVHGKLSNLKSLTIAAKSSLNANYLDDADFPSMIISSDDFTCTSCPTTLLSRLELSPRICIFSCVPKSITQLDNLCILKIGVGKLGGNGLEILRGLPKLKVLSLYIHTKPAERIVIGKTGFSVLKCFKFKCCQPLLEFELDAMPSLNRLKLCFNAPRTGELSIIPIGINHLSGVKEVSAKIGGAGPEETYRTAAEVALKEAIRPGGHATFPRVNVQCVSQMFGCFTDQISSITGDAELEHQKQYDNMENIDEHDVSFHSSRCIPALEQSDGEPRDSDGCTLSSVDDMETGMVVAPAHHRERQQHQKQELVASRSHSGLSRAGEWGSVTPLPSRPPFLVDFPGAPSLQHAFGAQAPEMERTGADVEGTSVGPVRQVTRSSPIQRPLGTRRTAITNRLEDGHVWRKYGQKDFQNSKHPKAYFRCTHKYDQNCAAQRQVQRCDDAPGTYMITYIGAHTCRDPSPSAKGSQKSPSANDADVLHAGSHLISNASGTTTSATTTPTGNTNNQQEGGVGKEEVFSSLTPAGSARNPVATAGPDRGT